MKRLGDRANRASSSWRRQSSGLVLGGVALVTTGVLGCQGGGGDFVGQERHPESGETCNLCTPAIDPTPVDCELAEEGIEFMPMPLWDFSDGNARNSYAYTDNTNSYWNLSDTWQPSAEETVRCQGRGSTFALHVKGGPYLNWGGGIGRHFKCLNGVPDNDPNNYDTALTGEVKVGTVTGALKRSCDARQPLHACDGLHPATQQDEEYEALSAEEKEALHSTCPDRDQAVMASHALRLEEADGEMLEADEELEAYRDAIGEAPANEEFLLGTTIDLSDWDGISFWARRSSNDTASGIRLSLGDKRTSDDLSFLQQHINPEDELYCRRNVECGCPGNGRCYAKEGDDIKRCWDSPPRVGETGDARFLECGDSICDNDYAPMQMPDSQTVGTTCNVFHSRGGDEEYFCFDPEEGPFPAERTDQCGDHWVHPVRLSTEWQFYKVPFNTLLQEGWAKEHFEFDLTSAAVLRFTWGTGWQDFWIDDVRVYRDLHNTTGDSE